MSSHTCPKCQHCWEEEIELPEWYDILITRPNAEVTVPPYSHCVKWLDTHEGAWDLVEEKAAVVETYWDPRKKKSPWGMLRTYIGKELRLLSERTEAREPNGMLKGGGRY